MSGWDAEYMGHGLFARCTSLTQVRLPGNISSLPARTFSGCTSLRQTNIGELAGLRTIGEGALAGCSSLAQISLPPSLRVIESLAFDGMSSLSSLELPQALTTIGDYAFRGCSSLGALVLPDAVTTLGLSPFYGCSALQQVVLSANLRNISDNYIFDHCPALQSIEISASNTLYSSSDGVLYNRAKNQIIAWPAALSRTKHPVLPTSATPLARGALMDCLLDENFCLPERMNTLRCPHPHHRPEIPDDWGREPPQHDRGPGHLQLPEPAGHRTAYLVATDRRSSLPRVHGRGGSRSKGFLASYGTHHLLQPGRVPTGPSPRR